MLSTNDLEKIITVKRREIEKEKALLGLCTLSSNTDPQDVQNHTEAITTAKEVNFVKEVSPRSSDDSKTEERNQEDSEKNLYDLEENIPPDLERYIRRYLGLPVMLRAGEYSPNNPLIRAERSTGDVFFGLGEYERRRNTLRKLRQQQYKEYLDEQARKKQEAKEQAEKERRAHEEKDKEREERERERLKLQREKESPDYKSLIQVPSTNNGYINSKVDTGIQVNGVRRPLSVAVQTDDAEIFPPCLSMSKYEMTQAERELSPRTVAGGELMTQRWETTQRRRSHGDYHEVSGIKQAGRERLMSELRHSYRPSIFDADAIKLRNLQAEKEAAARRQFYQQELKNQIMEQQRIREERKSREKLLEQAEMRRLEEQLRMLREAQEREVDRQRRVTTQMKENAEMYDNRRIELQKEIDFENQRLIHVKSQPQLTLNKQRDLDSKSDEITSKSLSRPPRTAETAKDNKPKPPPGNNTLISPDYDVEKYLRRNLNFNINKHDFNDYNKYIVRDDKKNGKENGNVVEIDVKDKKTDEIDSFPVPILRHSPINTPSVQDNNNLSDAMRKVEDKWKVPVVQKNILKSLPNDEGKNLSILTQLGSIRRQLQLEQLKLDNMGS